MLCNRLLQELVVLLVILRKKIQNVVARMRFGLDLMKYSIHSEHNEYHLATCFFAKPY